MLQYNAMLFSCETGGLVLGDSTNALVATALSEIKQTEEDKSCLIPLVWGT